MGNGGGVIAAINVVRMSAVLSCGLEEHSHYLPGTTVDVEAAQGGEGHGRLAVGHAGMVPPAGYSENVRRLAA